MTLRNSLDDWDLKILDIITKNARIPFKDVAKEVGISRAAVHQRVNRMVDLEVIVGSGYHINPKKVDFKTCTYIGIFLEKGELFTEVVKQLEQIPEIVECHYTTGAYAIFIKVYAKDNEHLKLILRDVRFRPDTFFRFLAIRFMRRVFFMVHLQWKY